MKRPKPYEAQLLSTDQEQTTGAETNLRLELHEEVTVPGSPEIQDKALLLLARFLLKAASQCPR
jgi:hypothetical protein